jgi:hypothetical protein
MTLREKSGTQMFVQYIFPIAMLWALLAFAPVIVDKYLAESHTGNFSGGHLAGFLAEA